MRYVLARYEQNNIDNAYRYYIADSFYLHNQNPPQYIGNRLHEILHPTKEVKIEDAEAIAKDVIARAGLTVIQDDSI